MDSIGKVIWKCLPSLAVLALRSNNLEMSFAFVQYVSGWITKGEIDKYLGTDMSQTDISVSSRKMAGPGGIMLESVKGNNPLELSPCAADRKKQTKKLGIRNIREKLTGQAFIVSVSSRTSSETHTPGAIPNCSGEAEMYIYPHLRWRPAAVYAQQGLDCMRSSNL